MNKKYFRDIFVVLTYRNTADVIDLLNSLCGMVDNYKVVIVNSYYDDDSATTLNDIAQEYDCDFFNVENKGYGCGNNAGIEYAKEHYEFDRIVITNPDIIVNKYDQKGLDSINDGIIGGNITCATGKRQNPLRVIDCKLSTNAAYEYYCKKNRVFFLAGIIFSKFLRLAFLMFNKKTKVKKVYAIHGSFFVITKESLMKIGTVFDENIFMFGEELDLAARFKNDNMAVYYTSLIDVYHKEDGSINMSNIDEISYLKISSEYVYNKYN